MKVRFLLVLLSVVSLLMLSGCASRYGAESFGTGYSEFSTAPDTFVVTFKGNGFTSQERTLNFALRRASELALQRGYNYFVVTNTKDHSQQEAYTTSHGNVSGSVSSSDSCCSSSTRYGESSSSNTSSGVITRPRLTLGIKCYQEKPNGIDVVDAGYFLASNTL